MPRQPIASALSTVPSGNGGSHGSCGEPRRASQSNTHLGNKNIGSSDPVTRKPLVRSKSSSAGRLSVVSLFSGCGGMDLGFIGDFKFGNQHYRRQPFEIVWANDLNERACDAYEFNLKHEIHRGSIANVMNTLPSRADIVIGGFPCQDVSINGTKSSEKGERTILYKDMIKVIKRVKPVAFVAENVKGLTMSHGAKFFEKMLKDFSSISGYSIYHDIYLAADYGVPQMRERVFIVGIMGKKKFNPPVPILTHMTAYEALHDLEDKPEDPEISHIWSKARPSPDQGSRRLKSDKPSTTIRAECHGNQQWHYRKSRRISLREAARLQSFPDSFTFPSGMRETERQIGNAVPPVLAWHIARALHEQLDR